MFKGTAAPRRWETESSRGPDMLSALFKSVLPRDQPLRFDSMSAAVLARHAQPQRGERWLVIGPGSARVAEALQEESSGPLKEVVGVEPDIAGFTGRRNGFRFLCFDYRKGLAVFGNAIFDGAILLDDRTELELDILRVLRPAGRVIPARVVVPT